MSAAETARRGLAQAVEALERRGATVEPDTSTRSRNTLRVRLPEGVPVQVYVKTRATGTWQTDVRKGTPTPESPDETRFWLFVDFTESPTTFYIAPEWWVENDIYQTYQADLARFGGSRPRSPGSTHHGIPKERISQWRERWDLLGLEP
jgi:hypothetical protein